MGGAGLETLEHISHWLTVYSKVSEENSALVEPILQSVLQKGYEKLMTECSWLKADALAIEFEGRFVEGSPALAAMFGGKKPTTRE